MINGLRTCIYLVSNLSEAISWYSEAFQTEPYFNEPFYAGFNIKGYELGLMPQDSNPMEKGDSVMTYWGVEDIQKEFNRLVSLGATIHEEPNNVGGPIEVATVKDPWGNIIGLIFNPTFNLE